MVNNLSTETEIHDARSRLVISALRLFAEKGFEAATTREICEAAGANISAIRYYFGDKASLYRAVFTEPVGETKRHTNIEAYLRLPLAEALDSFFTEFLEPLKKGEEVRLVMKLHFREMIEPTGIRQQETGANLKLQHEILVAILKEHLDLQRIDADVHRLAFAIIGMAVHFYVAQEVVAAISPQVLNTLKAIDSLAERLAGYAISMIEGETRRRAQ
ncbi:MAG: CerR family C-terminal domain-containing protein [Methylobacter sp.]|uniref:CerR family C-terminal domain-containing protein n=1 Tax=Candidatus Methylobacter titanis TaxID=3053457 RepID=A0AA43TMR7_9GAMM|nr:CerR family C-terminal domain-containing protein [Candidatus Methylobacter titanis]